MVNTIIISLLLISNLFISNKSFQTTVDDYQISDPISYKNLSVFMIYGDDKIKANNIITLQEAIEQKKIIIHETENVNELHVQNISNINIFIQSGDIVKGGKQDRIFQYDIVIKPRSGRVPVSSFCVEQQRWSKRGDEDLYRFNSSDKRVSSKKLKMAAKQAASQSDVWYEVAGIQERLSGVVGSSVNSDESASSLQLTLENKKIKKLSKEYMDHIAAKLNFSNNAVGYVFSINGEINSADIYASSTLFKKMWPKLFEASATEAVSESKESNAFKEITTSQVRQWLSDVEKGKESNKSINEDIDIRVKDSKESVLYETYTKDGQNNWIHKNIIKK